MQKQNKKQTKKSGHFYGFTGVSKKLLDTVAPVHFTQADKNTLNILADMGF